MIQFFRNGAPFDHLYDYYKFLWKIIGKITQFSQDEARKIITAQLSLKDAPKLKGPTEPTSKAELDRVIRGQASLLMNYVEEIFQIGLLERNQILHPGTRATSDQLHEISLLLCDIMSSTYSNTFEEVKWELLNAVFNQNLPVVIKSKIKTFVTILNEHLKNTTRLYLVEEGSKMVWRNKKYHKKWSSKLSDAFKGRRLPDTDSELQEIALEALKEADRKAASNSRKAKGRRVTSNRKILKEEEILQNELKRRVDFSAYPQDIIPLQDDPEIWEAIKSTTEREFNTIEQNSAKTLIDCLESVKRGLHNRPFFSKVYYTMEKTEPWERKEVLKNFQATLQATKSIPQSSLASSNKVLKSMIQNSLEPNVNYPEWHRKVWTEIMNLPTDLVMVLDDIFSDSSHKFTVKKKHQFNSEQNTNLSNLLISDHLRQKILMFDYYAEGSDEPLEKLPDDPFLLAAIYAVKVLEQRYIINSSLSTIGNFISFIQSASKEISQ
ncbi:hypothetical protein PGTUg99_026874 [Puccinia graminis f. sp. tritici]|uniref:Uncharacterized protein n=1 Tax=Puccinia graminis f. sp. tritici TaxID=56615 RepID=A0A5B0M9R8_PUCGR|nr:hypothetical protein PGTUg99_026874 [Puccinia graminis f. sp. tritici]